MKEPIDVFWGLFGYVVAAMAVLSFVAGVGGSGSNPSSSRYLTEGFRLSYLAIGIHILNYLRIIAREGGD